MRLIALSLVVLAGAVASLSKSDFADFMMVVGLGVFAYEWWTTRPGSSRKGHEEGGPPSDRATERPEMD